MATFTFTAIEADGTAHTRTSGTMPYVAITVGSQVQWHKTMAAAQKAAVSRTQTWKTGVPATIIPAEPTSVQGKIELSEVENGWGDIPAEKLVALVQAKNAGAPSQAALDARVESAPVPSQDDIDATIQAEMDAQAAKRAKAAADRRRQRAAKKAREAGQEAPVAEAPAVYPGEAEFDQLRAAKEARQRASRVAPAEKAEKAPAKPKGVKAITADGKKVWRGSGPAYNAYRRMREVRLQAKAAREAGDIAKAEALEVKVEERRVAWEQAKADEKASA